MDEDEKPRTEDDPTPGEQEIEDETGTSGEEAHRIGEFDDLRDRLERIENTLGTITSTLEAMRTTATAIDIDNGADVMDGDGDGDVDVAADDEIEIPDYEDMDLDL
jgi:hypothetical protein